MKIVISTKTRDKLTEKHQDVTENDVRQCFANRCGPELIDGRADHLTNPVTRWFISETDSGRQLKICFMQYSDRIVVKTAYEPNEDEVRIYRRAMK